MEALKTSRVVYVFQFVSYKTKSTFLLMKYGVATLLVEWRNLFRIRSSNAKFSKYQKQLPGGSRWCPVKKVFFKKIKKLIEKYSYSVFNF